MFIGFRIRITSILESGKTTFILEPFYFEEKLIQAVNTKKNSERIISNGNG